MKILITLIIAILLSACSRQVTEEIRLVCKKDNNEVTFESDYYKQFSVNISISDDVAMITATDRYNVEFSLARKIVPGETCYVEHRNLP